MKRKFLLVMVMVGVVNMMLEIYAYASKPTIDTPVSYNYIDAFGHLRQVNSVNHSSI